jgi:hypothetical protein
LTSNEYALVQWSRKEWKQGETSQEGKEKAEMTYYPDFDSHSIRERNEGLRREVSTYRLEKQLRQNREPRSGLSNLTASGGFSRGLWRVCVLGGSLLKRAGREFVRNVLWRATHNETLLRGNRGTWGESGHPGFLDGGGFGGGYDGGGGGDGGGG